MTILRTDKIAGLESVNAITGSVFFGNGDQASGITGNNILITEESSDFTFGTGDFTIEGWFYTPDLTNWNMLVGDNVYSSAGGWSFYINTSPYIDWWKGGAASVVSGGAATVNTWHHIAFSRESGTNRVFLDGALGASASDSTDYTSNQILIGANQLVASTSVSQWGFKGYASNVRVIKGKAIYGGAFTPPTRQLEVTPETVLLCCQSSQDPTQEATGKTLNTLNTPIASTFVPDVGNDHTHGTVLEGNVEFPSLNYMTLPRGTTTQRANSRGRAVIPGGYNPAGSPNAAKSLNTIEYIEINTTANAVDFGDLSFGSASGASCGSSTRGLIGGSYISPSVTGSLNNIDYITIASTGNGADFGDLTQGRSYLASFSSSTRGIWAGGVGSPTPSPYMSDVIDYVTIATTGDATDFGDSADVAYYGAQGASSPTRGIWTGGNPAEDMIQYVTIASTGNANEFGNLSANRKGPSEASSSTRCIIAGGYTPTVLNTMEYITIATTGNAEDFGDLTFAGAYIAGTSNSVRAVWCGRYTSPGTTNTIEYTEIQTLGNAQDFGDLISSYTNLSGATSDTHGGLA